MSTSPSMSSIVVARAELSSPEVQALILTLNAELTHRYPEEGQNHFRLDPDEVAPGRGAILLARDGGAAGIPVGCGAVRLIAPTTAEIKRMYTVPAARGRGIAGMVLNALEAEARRLGAARLLLETGVRQPEAIAVYERSGFVRIAAYGEYVDSPLSVCMEKHLVVG